MEFIEGIVNHFRRPKAEKTKTLPITPTPKVWNYEYFREYLMALTGGNNSLLPISSYPDIIELSEGWHRELDKMRADTLDGRERYTTISYERTNRSIRIAQNHLVGASTHVSGETIQLARSRVFGSGMDGIIGDIHSHPRGGREATLGQFSAADYYTLLVAGSRLFMMALVDGDENIFAFRTASTKSTEVNIDLLNQENFSRIWYERNGFKYLGINQGVVPLSDTASSWNVNKGIANRHGLVVYGGGIGEELVRLIPSV